jgi:hypothetical protein
MADSASASSFVASLQEQKLKDRPAEQGTCGTEKAARFRLAYDLLGSEKIKVIRTPVQAPNANAHGSAGSAASAASASTGC